MSIDNTLLVHDYIVETQRKAGRNPSDPFAWPLSCCMSVPYSGSLTDINLEPFLHSPMANSLLPTRTIHRCSALAFSGKPVRLIQL